jgi:hypothetical protein
MKAKLDRVPTRLRLPVEQVDLTIRAGRDALRVNAAVQRAIQDIRRRAGVAGQTALAAE